MSYRRAWLLRMTTTTTTGRARHRRLTRRRYATALVPAPALRPTVVGALAELQERGLPLTPYVWPQTDAEVEGVQEIIGDYWRMTRWKLQNNHKPMIITPVVCIGRCRNKAKLCDHVTTLNTKFSNMLTLYTMLCVVTILHRSRTTPPPITTDVQAL